MTDFETVPVGTTKEMERVEQERDALAAHVERLHQALNDQLTDCINFDDGQLTTGVQASSAQVLEQAPATRLSAIKCRWQAEALEALASDCAGNRDVYERCMVRAADLRIQQQGDEVENNEQFT